MPTMILFRVQTFHSLMISVASICTSPGDWSHCKTRLFKQETFDWLWQNAVLYLVRGESFRYGCHGPKFGFERDPQNMSSPDSGDK